MSSIFAHWEKPIAREDRVGRAKRLIQHLNCQLQTLAYEEMDAEDHEHMSGYRDEELQERLQERFDTLNGRKEILEAMM